MIMTKAGFIRALQESIQQVELDPEKFYLLVVPESISEEQLKQSLRQTAGKLNIIVLRANNVNLIELT